MMESSYTEMTIPKQEGKHSLSSKSSHPSTEETLKINEVTKVIFLNISKIIYDHQYFDWFCRLKSTEIFTSIKPQNKTDAIDAVAVLFFNLQALQNLQMLINQNNNIGIVITSSLRAKRSVNKLKKLFKIHDFSKYIIGKIPGIGFADRANRIAYWLQSNPQISSYVIFDDRDIFSYSLNPDLNAKIKGEMSKHIVKVNCKTLLSRDNIQAAQKILNNSYKRFEKFTLDLPEVSDIDDIQKEIEEFITVEQMRIMREVFLKENGQDAIEEPHPYLTTSNLDPGEEVDMSIYETVTFDKPSNKFSSSCCK